MTENKGDLELLRERARVCKNLTNALADSPNFQRLSCDVRRDLILQMDGISRTLTNPIIKESLSAEL